jgi:hypothetical protein
MATTGRKIAALFVAVAIAATLFGPMTAAVANSTGTQSVANETVTAAGNSYVEVTGYDVDDTSLTVERYNETSDSYETVSEGTDYEFNYSDGAIKALSGGDIGDGDELRLTYDYQATDATTTTVAGLIPLFLALLVLVTLAAGIMQRM